MRLLVATCEDLAGGFSHLPRQRRQSGKRSVMLAARLGHVSVCAVRARLRGRLPEWRCGVRWGEGQARAPMGMTMVLARTARRVAG